MPDLPSSLQPPPELLGKVLARVRAEEVRRARIRAVVHSAFLLAIVLAFALLATQFIQDLYATGFVELARLAWTDGASIASNLTYYLYGLSEAFPDGEFALCLALLASGLYVMRHYYRGPRPGSRFRSYVA